MQVFYFRVFRGSLKGVGISPAQATDVAVALPHQPSQKIAYSLLPMERNRKKTEKGVSPKKGSVLAYYQNRFGTLLLDVLKVSVRQKSKSLIEGKYQNARTDPFLGVNPRILTSLF